VYKIRANTPFCAYAYGFNWCDSYGHPASVALGDLEKQDTLAPDPQWILASDGTVQGTGGKDEATVEDLPRNDSRSNLAMIYFDSHESFNYRFTYKDFIPGESAMTTWRAWVNDVAKDAKAVITFSDRCGNDTTIIIEYFVRKLDFKPDLDFGKVLLGDSAIKDIWLYNFSSSRSYTITELKLKSNTTNFQIMDIILPMGIPINDSIKVRIKFLARDLGEFIDSIGAGDSFFFEYTGQLKANAVDSITGVQDNDTSNLSKANILNFRVFPNPFENGTTFSFDSNIPGTVIEIEIYDILGSKITELNCLASEGENRLNWNGRDLAGNKLRSGVYFARLKNGAVYSKVSCLIFIQ
jgi:hypothetical protein